jgi:hypothetical protein
MKTKVLFWFTAIIIAVATIVSCEKEVNIYVPEQKPIVVYHKDNIRVESIETDKPTEGCSFGQVSVSVYRNDTLISLTVYCKDSIPPASDICPQYWDFIGFEGEEVCDTLYNYDCNWNLNFKVPICKPLSPEVCLDNWEYVEYTEEGACDTLYRYDCNGNLDVAIPFCKTPPQDTVIVILPGDTVYITITEESAYLVFPLLYEDCDKGSSPYYHNELGWTVLNTGFSINPYFDDGSANEHGAIVFYYGVEKDAGIIWTPYLSSPFCQEGPPNLYSTWIYSGSRIESQQEFWVMYEDRSIEKIQTGITRMTSDFEWYKHYDDNTWSKENLFSFKEDDLGNPKAPGIIKMGIGYKKTSDKPILCRNDKYNADEWHILGYKLIPKKSK